MAEGRIATIGMFDGVHAGHRHVLGQLCRAGASMSLAPTVFTFDVHPLRVIDPERAPKLLGTISQRADLIIGTGVSEVIFLGFDARLRLLTDVQFLHLLRDRYDVRALLVGFNHRFGYRAPQPPKGGVADAESLGAPPLGGWGAEAGAALEIIPCGELACGCHVSSSAIRRLLAAGDVAGANAMLGYNYALRGTVVHGRGLGHTIGFPTVNVEPLDSWLLVPASGVYAAEASLRDGSVYPAMVNVGSNPTVNPDRPDRTFVEAHLIGFDGNLYGQPITLHFVGRLRDERRFPSIDDLRQQLAADRENALAQLSACKKKQPEMSCFRL